MCFAFAGVQGRSKGPVGKIETGLECDQLFPRKLRNTMLMLASLALMLCDCCHTKTVFLTFSATACFGFPDLLNTHDSLQRTKTVCHLNWSQ
jgi:hypothetical protein